MMKAVADLHSEAEKKIYMYAFSSNDMIRLLFLEDVFEKDSSCKSQFDLQLYKNVVIATFLVRFVLQYAE